MALAETAELAVRISLKDNVSGGIRGLQKNLGGLNRSLAQTGRGVGQIGAGLTRAGLVVGGAAIAGIAGAARAAIDFEDAFAGVRKTINETELTAAGLSFEALAQQFRDMATEIPIAATELAAIGETAGALGIRAQDIEEFTRTVALLGATTNLTSDEAAESLGKIGTILNLTGDQFEDFADILVNLGNKGASTEAEIIEITKRFAASGRQAGLSIPQILAYASAIASAGAEPEAAGSSLSRLFGNLITETARATDKGKAFAKVTGKSFKDFSDIVKNDTNGAMIAFLQSLNKLDKFGQQTALKEVGITNVRDRNAILLLAGTINTNLLPAFENANNAAGALSAEAQKRFDTIASKIKLFKNNITEAGITIGEGFLPALGRATDKLIAFLKVDANKSALKGIGEDIGRSIDNIDWDAVLRGARQFVGLLQGALSFAKLMYDAFSALPGPIKEATAGFLVLNKLSGGLIGAGAGNVIGGLAGAAIQGAASRAPGIGRLFAQPVFVTNFPPGFGGGLGAGAAGAAGTGLSGVSKMFLVGEAIGLALLVNEVRNGIADGVTRQSEAIETQTQAFLRQNPSTTDLKNALLGVEQGILNLERNPLNVLVQGDALTNLQQMRDAIRQQIANQGKGVVGPEKFGPPVPGKAVVGTRPFAFPAAPGVLEATLERGRKAGFNPTPSAVNATYERTLVRTAEAQRAATERVRSAVLAGTLALQGGMNRPIPAPIVNVNVGVSPTNIVNKTIYYNRAGPTGGSRDQGNRIGGQ